MRVLLLGGTTEASHIALALAEAGVEGTFSYAGRTTMPVTQPIPTRVGGFGGIDGLVRYLKRERITHVIDATHPFAAQISRNAVEACSRTAAPLIAYKRANWFPLADDNWHHVSDIDAAVAALPNAPARIFLAIGKQSLSSFAAQPHHFYLLRLVDAPAAPLPFPKTEVVLARGPFTTEGDLALLSSRRITHVVAKNAGGTGATAKLEAARMLGLKVIMINRPRMPERETATSVEEIMNWVRHSARLGV